MPEELFTVQPINPSQPLIPPGRQPWWRKLWLAVLGVGALVLVISITYFFINRSPFREEQVEFTLTAPENIKSGELVNYQVKINNQSVVRLQDVKLTFFYPPGATALTAGQTRLAITEEVKVGDIAAKSERLVNFSAYLVGDEGEIKQARAKLVFVPSNLRSTFEREAVNSLVIGELAVGLSLAAPPNVISGQSITYTVDYRNATETEQKELRLRLDYPTGFQFTHADPTPSQGNNLWEISTLPVGADKRITITGQLIGREKEEKVVTAVLQRRENNSYIDYEKISGVSTISTTPLNATILINDQSSHVPQPGEALRYQIQFTNRSTVALQGLSVTAQLTGNMYNLDSVNTNGAYDAGQRTITWNASVSPVLISLAPQQTGAVNFSVRLKDKLPGSNLNARDFIIKVAAKVSTPTTPPGINSDGLVALAELTSRVSAQPTISQTAWRTDSTGGSSGPLPPKVGQKTIYTINWKAQSVASDFSNVTIRARLPVSAIWVGLVPPSYGSAVPVYKANTREIIWSLGQLSAGTGGSLPAAEAWFQVAVTPTINQAGDILDLMEAATLSGRDNSTGEEVVVRTGKLNSNQLLDQPNQGRVQE